MSVEGLAAVFRGGASAELACARMDDPGPTQVRVRLEGCGVCASNLPVWEGRPWFQYPFAPGAPGHEGWGRVDAVGREVRDVRCGERVAFLSQNAYAQYDLASADAVVKVPDALADAPVPGEPLACVMNIFRRAEICAGQTVAIVGIGFLGAALTQLASRAGARVIAISRRDYSLEVAERCGAWRTIRLADVASGVAEAQRVCGGQACERVIEAVGSQKALDVATALTAVRARLVIAGYHQDGPRQVDLQQWNWRGLDVVNAHERDPGVYRQGMQEAIERVTSGTFDPAPLYTHRFPLHEIGAAFEALSRRPHGFIKALIDCS